MGVVDKIKAFYRREWGSERAREANKSLVKAGAFFAGAVFVSRNFGDSFAI
jgi:hypothetical protein